MNKNGVVIVEDSNNIPRNTLCVFGQKIPRGIRYVIGYVREDVLYIHFSQQKYSLDDIISYQYVYSISGRIIKK